MENPVENPFSEQGGDEQEMDEETKMFYTMIFGTDYDEDYSKPN